VIGYLHAKATKLRLAHRTPEIVMALVKNSLTRQRFSIAISLGERHGFVEFWYT
jgi:hypothetical protein